MSLLNLLSSEETWKEFREYKSLHSHMSNREFDELDTFISEKRYLSITDRLDCPGHGFSLPQKHIINKSGTQKKRTVYTFPPDETLVLKLLTWLLFKYDGCLSSSCCSFRRSITVKDTVFRIMQIPDLEKKYTLKMDIHNYFNSMPVEKLKDVLREIITDDEPLLRFLCDLLSVNRAVFSGVTVEEERGAMAGVPLSAFLANVYLLSLDREFDSLGVPYFRYSDDLIVFAGSDVERRKLKELIGRRIAEKGLEPNPDKTAETDPGQPWEFLGFEYRDGRLDLSHVTLNKMKAKIRRKCRALYRWRIKKNVDFDRAAGVVIRVFNRKFYDVDNEYDFTWSRWFFPVLTTDRGLHTLDEYFVNELRYIYTGRHCKGNYAVTYERLKRLGYRSLVNEYYRFKAEAAKLRT